MTKIAELYGLPTFAPPTGGWGEVTSSQPCPYLKRKCLKIRKSQPDTTIGSCTVTFGRTAAEIVICPHRLLQRRQIFTDCLHLLTRHEPGNELHIIAELGLPGGNVDYCLASVRRGKVVDFAGVELQTLDTTGTVWPERQQFLRAHGVKVAVPKTAGGFGMNWKMTAKTTLVQLHHKIDTFQHVDKRLVLVIQDRLLTYMEREFAFGHLESARLGDPMHFHAYRLTRRTDGYALELDRRLSTDRDGIAKCLGLQGEANVELDELLRQIESKLSQDTVMILDGSLPAPAAPIDASG